MNVHPGDLAIVVKSDIPEVVGMIVEVVSGAGIQDDEGLFEWFVRPSAPSRCFLPDGSIGVLELVGCPDAWLRPLSGLPIDEETREELTA